MIQSLLQQFNECAAPCKHRIMLILQGIPPLVGADV